MLQIGQVAPLPSLVSLCVYYLRILHPSTHPFIDLSIIHHIKVAIVWKLTCSFLVEEHINFSRARLIRGSLCIDKNTPISVEEPKNVGQESTSMRLCLYSFEWKQKTSKSGVFWDMRGVDLRCVWTVPWWPWYRRIYTKALSFHIWCMQCSGQHHELTKENRENRETWETNSHMPFVSVPGVLFIYSYTVEPSVSDRPSCQA